jgi:hypothetical protein
MLKKLLIGFLILSALTSEGAVDLKATLKNLCLFSETELNLLYDIANHEISATQPEVKNGKNIVNNLYQRIEYLGYTLRLPSEGFGNGITPVVADNLDAANRKFVPVLYIYSNHQPDIKKNKGIIFEQSDASPPALSI